MYGGDGLARLPEDEHGRGKTVFLPFVLEGEIVEARLHEQKRSFARAQAESILEPSPHRVEPACPYFQRCGGCHYQHASYDHQLEIKATILKENLRRLAKLELPVPLEVHPSPPWNYRNRTRLKVHGGEQFALGYYKFNSHELLPVEQCPISSPLINRTITALWHLGRSGQIAREIREIEIFTNSDDSRALIELYCEPDAPRRVVRQCAEDLKTALPAADTVAAFKATPEAHSPVDLTPIVTLGSGALNYRVGERSYRVSAGAFFQANRYLVDELVRIVAGGALGERALDLYAGVGLFSTALAESFPQVICVESSPTGFPDLAYNSPTNARAAQVATGQFLSTQGAGLSPDLVVVDPPRSGLGGSVVRQLASLQAPRLTYVSCDPATLCRDLAGLLEAGYHIGRAHLVDLFPQTFHVESVFQLVR